jgi:methionyl-tRNA formyltransferase
MKAAPIKIVIAGASAFSVPTVKRLNDLDYQIVAVLTQPDRAAGRGLKQTKNPVKLFAEKAGLTLLDFESLDGENVFETIKKLSPDLLITIAYGGLIPQKILDIPRCESINIHPSLLPLWRGASPIQSAILNGDTKTGISLIRMIPELDAGPIFAVTETSIDPEENTLTLSNRLANMSAILMTDNIEDIVNKNTFPNEQEHQKATYASKLTKQDAIINWTRSASEILKKIKAFNPWPVAHSILEQKNFRIWDAKLSKQINDISKPGSIIKTQSKEILVATGDRMLSLISVQLEGRKKMLAQDFFKGFACEGKTLGQ